MKSRGKSRLVHAAIGVAVAVSFAACGSDDSSSNEGNDSGAPSDKTVTDNPKKFDPSKPPVLLGYGGDSVAGVQDVPALQLPGIEATLKYINDELGGFGGSEVKITKCDGHFDPAATTACARQFVEEGVLAMFGTQPALTTGGGLDVLTAAGIPAFNQATEAVQEAQPNNISLSSGNRGSWEGAAHFLCTQDDAQVISYIYIDVPVVRSMLGDSVKVLEDCGKEASITWINPASPDPSAPITKALEDDPDWIATDVGAAGNIQTVGALAQQGFPADHIIVGASSLLQSYLDEAGDLSKDQIFMSESHNLSDESNEDVALYNKILQVYDGGEPINDFKAVAVMQLMSIYSAAEAIGFDALDSASLLDYFNTAPTFKIFMGPEGTNPPPNPDAPSIKNQSVMPVQWDGEKFTTVLDEDGGWLNAY